jgi:hypothetical protein
MTQTCMEFGTEFQDLEPEVLSYRTFCVRNTLEAWHQRRREYERRARDAQPEDCGSHADARRSGLTQAFS